MNLKDTQLGHEAHAPSGITYPVSIIAHDIDDAANVGSLFRLADALGIECLYLTGSTITPPDRKLVKTSRSTDKAVAWQQADHPASVLDKLTTQSYRVLALELSVNSIPLRELDIKPADKLCLLIGNESKGLSDDLLACAEAGVHIPMLGQNSSMNVAMATAIAGWEILRQLQG